MSLFLKWGQTFYDGAGNGGGSGSTNPVGMTAIDNAGQSWVVQVVDQGHAHDSGYFDIYGWVQTSYATDPRTVPGLSLPRDGYFPGLMISLGGHKWQVSTDGKSWQNPYDFSSPSIYYTVKTQTPHPRVFPNNDAPDGRDDGITQIVLDIPLWPTSVPADGTWHADLIPSGVTLSDISYWTTAVAVPEKPTPDCYTLTFADSIDGIRVGDKLTTLDSSVGGSWTVAGVDPILFQVNTIEKVTNVPVGTKIYWDSSSQSELTLEDPRDILVQAVYPYSVNLSEFQSGPKTAEPVFGWLPVRGSAQLRAIGDIEPTLTSMQITPGNYLTGNPPGWVGTPDQGWAAVGAYGQGTVTQHYDWTRQVVSAPGSLMPVRHHDWEYLSRLRNRVYSNTYLQENNGIIKVNGTYVPGTFVNTVSNGVYSYVSNGITYNSTGGDHFELWSSGLAYQPLAKFTHYDYRAYPPVAIEISGSYDHGFSVEMYPWYGASYGGPATYTFPTDKSILSFEILTPMPGAYLVYTAKVYVTIYNGVVTSVDWNNPTLDLWAPGSGIISSVTVPSALKGGQLISTPYATYMVGASAIAEITVVNNVLNFNTIYLNGAVTWLWPNTLCARTADDFVILGRLDVAQKDGTADTSTWIFNLRTHFGSLPTLYGSVITSEEIAEGAPTVCGCTRDPSKSGRIVGHYGGSLWQFDREVPMSLDRFVPGGMSAMDLIEHIAQTFCLVTVPDNDGVLHMVPRTNAPGVINLTVPQISVDKYLNWQEFASIVRVTTKDNNYYYDAFGQQGGAYLEISEHPLVWSLSGCAAMAQGLIQWFGQPRTVTESKWIWGDSDSAAPWEGLRLFSRITVTDSVTGVTSEPQRLMSISQNYITGTATVKTVGA